MNSWGKPRIKLWVTQALFIAFENPWLIFKAVVQAQWGLPKHNVMVLKLFTKNKKQGGIILSVISALYQ